MTVDPSFMSPVEWSDITGSEIERRFRGIIAPRLDNVNNWREWGRAVVDNKEIASLNPPRPEDYDNFLDWARAFNNAVRY